MTRYFWDFFGPDAERTAQHFRRHLDEFLEKNAHRGWTKLEDFRGARRDRVVAHSQIRRPEDSDYHGGHESYEGYAEPAAKA